MRLSKEALITLRIAIGWYKPTDKFTTADLDLMVDAYVQEVMGNTATRLACLEAYCADMRQYNAIFSTAEPVASKDAA